MTELSEIIDTQIKLLRWIKFAALDKVRLRASLGEIKKMRVKMNLTKKVTEMKVE